MVWNTVFIRKEDKGLHGIATAEWMDGEIVLFTFTQQILADTKGIEEFKLASIQARDRWEKTDIIDTTLAITIKTALNTDDTKVVK